MMESSKVRGTVYPTRAEIKKRRSLRKVGKTLLSIFYLFYILVIMYFIIGFIYPGILDQRTNREMIPLLLFLLVCGFFLLTDYLYKSLFRRKKFMR